MYKNEKRKLISRIKEYLNTKGERTDESDNFHSPIPDI